MNKLTESKTCGAKLRNKDAYCRNKAILVNGRCRKHGGLTPKGIASPHYKHGRYSKHLPNRLRDRYNSSLNDPELTALRDDLALIDTHISEALTDFYSTESNDGEKSIRDKVKLCRLSLLEYDSTEKPVLAVAELLGEIDKELELCAYKTVNISKLLALLEQRRKTAESKNRRVFKSSNALSVEQAVAFVRLLGDSIKRHVRDQRQLAAIFEDFSKALV